jgi:adenylate cyclase class 2
MQPEIEAKFLNADFDAIRKKLRLLDGQCTQPMRLMRRAIMDYPDRRLQTEKSGWIRVRDEGDKITLTYKTSVEGSFGGATEIELEIGEYQKAIDLFEAVGMVVHSRQESKRETWILGNTEIVLDEWPWLNPYIEVEAPTEDIVRATAEKLGFRWDDAIFGSVTSAYRAQYPAIGENRHISTIPEITFSSPRPEWFTEADV